MAAPWIMWGSDQGLSISDPGGGGGERKTTGQLARIDYARPESWNFWFYLNVLTDPGLGSTVVVDFELQLGLGRSSLVIQKFCTFDVNQGTPPGFPYQIYATQFIGPPRSELEITDGKDNLITEFTAQSINCVARAQLINAIGPGSCDIVVACWFSPKVHVRPEWFKDGSFSGGENAGT